MPTTLSSRNREQFEEFIVDVLEQQEDGLSLNGQYQFCRSDQGIWEYHPEQ